MPHALFELCTVAPVFLVCAFGPGFLLVRRLDWSPVEKIAAAFTLSILAVGCTVFALYLADAPRWSFDVVTAACAGTLLIAHADWRQLFREVDARRIGALYALVAAWALGCCALIRTFGGGAWSGDWLEHYMRSRFFVLHMPLHTIFSMSSELPARPPLMNLFCAQVLGTTGTGFPAYQMLCVFLTAGLVFPMYLIAQRVSAGVAVPVAILAALMVFNPVLVQHATYPWTKALASAFVATALTFYVASWKDGDSLRFKLAVVAAAAAMATHYSTIIYVAILAIHFAMAGRKHFARPAAAFEWMILVPVAAVMPWILWTVRTYGKQVAFAGSPQIQSMQDNSGAKYLQWAAMNIFNTLVPYPLRGLTLGIGETGGGWIRLHEAAFMIYQTNAFLMLGSGTLLVLGAAARRWREVGRESGMLWAGLIVAGIIVGVGTLGIPDDYGLAHVTLQPLVVVGVAAAAGLWSTSPFAMRVAAIAGMAIDLVLGIGLHLLAESRAFPDGPEKVEFSGIALNSEIKHHWRVKYLGDFLAPAQWAVAAVLVVGAVILFVVVVRATRRLDERPLEGS